jgi:hypothetical protein
VPLPFPSDELASVKQTGSDDTLIFWHSDFDPPRVMRQGQDDEWNADWLPLEFIPQLGQSTSFVGDQNGINSIVIFPNRNRKLNLPVEFTPVAFLQVVLRNLRAIVAA